MRNLRRAIAAAVLVAFTAMFAGLPWCAAKYIAPLAKCQLWPAVVVCGVNIYAVLIAIATLVFGRWYCSILCPLGILQDAAFALHAKRNQNASGRKQWIVRIAFLAVFLAVGAAGFGYAWLEPYGMFGRIFTTVAGAALGAAIFALAVWKGRVWCNWVCPVGTLLGILSRILPTGLKINPSSCIGCRKCERNCRASAITIEGKGKGGVVDASKCVQCRDCIALCPKGAIAAKLTLQPSTSSRKDQAASLPQPVSRSSRHNSSFSILHSSFLPLTRREFLIGSAATVASVALNAAEEKTVDGGYADITSPGIDKRNASLKPAGSLSIANFRSKCVGCQLCVRECPNRVLRPSMRLKDFMQPEMAFDKGFCTTDCTRCSEVCPAGAITPISPEEKIHTHIGHAVWHKDRCLAATDGVNCTACFRHCPVNAIKRVPGEDGALIPVVDTFACIGCGACEHVCPARPMPGMTVKAFERHRSARPMGEGDALAAAREFIEKRGAACVVIKSGIIESVKRGRGVSPLLEVLDEKPALLKGAWVVDKVIGRAAAAICAVGGVERVYALTASTDAIAFLAAHGIKCETDAEVPRIMNRDKSGLCPMEQACEGLDDPERMVEALRDTIARLKRP